MILYSVIYTAVAEWEQYLLRKEQHLLHSLIQTTQTDTTGELSDHWIDNSWNIPTQPMAPVADIGVAILLDRSSSLPD